jgi:hypothetical protein
MSIDQAETFIIGNPGELDADEEAALEAEIAGLPDGPERSALEARLAGFRSLRGFDRPRRDHEALELTAVKRFGKGWFVQGSYTLSRTRGNYPGLLDADTGAALPNFSTQYDLPELLANRDGPLPQDRTHYLKVDASYTLDLERAGAVTAGLRARAFSGSPVDTLGSSEVYGLGEAFLLPRGRGGRTPIVTSTDLHLGYGRALARGWMLDAFVDVINLFNQEQVAGVDELYTTDDVVPVVGGEARDLIWAKRLGPTGGETSEPVERNLGYRTPLSRYAPLYVRFGVRMTF